MKKTRISRLRYEHIWTNTNVNTVPFDDVIIHEARHDSNGHSFTAVLHDFLNLFVLQYQIKNK